MPDTRYGHNPSGAADPTRTQVLRYVADGAGFEIVGRVTLIDKRTGRVYK